MANKKLAPMCDLILEVDIEQIDTSAGAIKKVPQTTGTVWAMLCDSNGPAATEIHASLKVAVAHVAGKKWIATFDRSILTAAILEPAFGGANLGVVIPYVIIDNMDGSREYIELEYESQRAAS